MRLGLKKIPIINLGPINDATAQEVGLVDNGRYGVDDADQLAQLLRGLGDSEELSEFLPYSSKELESIFKTEELNLDDLDVNDDDDEFDLRPTDVDSSPTHQILRFKVPLNDAERISELIERTMKAQGLNESDALTNAGDALVHLLCGGNGHD